MNREDAKKSISELIGNIDPAAVGPKGEIKTEGGRMRGAT